MSVAENLAQSERPVWAANTIVIVTLLLPLVLFIKPCSFQYFGSETGLERECVWCLNMMVDISQIILGPLEPAMT